MVARMMKNCTSCGDVQIFSVTSPKPDPCKLANGRPCASCFELENFDREAEAILERLSEDRRKILAKINRDHDPFIQRFPLELASRVFDFCIPPQDTYRYPRFIPLLWNASKSQYIKPFNIVLGAICQAWRQVAWSTPELWSTLPISLHRCGNRTYKGLVLEWLGRSAQTPLDVFLVDNDVAGSVPLTEEYVEVWKPFIDIANGCSSRWRSFHIHASDLVLSYITGDGQGTCILECLRVSLAESEHQRSSHRFSLTNAIPMPSELYSIAMPLRSIDIDWSNLITIEIGGLYVNEFLALLRWAPRLTRCKLLDLQDGQDEALLLPTPTCHHILHTLEIEALHNQRTAEQLLGLLNLPSLISLFFDSVVNSVENVATFLDRSACRLTTLNDIDGNFHKLLALAPHLQALERLEYPGDFGSVTIQEKNELGPNILPNLRRILICGGQIPWCLWADLIVSCPPKPLSIHVEGLDSHVEDLLIDKGSTRRFQDLIKNGYDIEITYRLWDEGERDLLAWSVERQSSGLNRVY